jgi:hypothetical protein
MTAIYRGHRYTVVATRTDVVTLESLATPGPRVEVSVQDPDLMLDPTEEDLSLGEAFERGEIGAFEYPDGHTYPPNQEIPKRRRRPPSNGVH